MEILKFPSLTEPQYAGCVSAFVDSLAGELNAASTFLKRLERSGKGAGFAQEIGLDRGRYGALLVLYRWRHLNAAFGPHLSSVLSEPALKELTAEAERRVTAGETILRRINEMIDSAANYHAELVEAALLGFQQVHRIFQQESELSARAVRLGAMLPEEQREARAIFLADLARR